MIGVNIISLKGNEMCNMFFVGLDMQIRMNLLGLSVKEVADKAFLEEEYIEAILHNKVALNNIDEFDLNLLCSILRCKPEYFTNRSEQLRDLLYTSINSKNDTQQSKMVKTKIQDFMNDYNFVNETLLEIEN